jgi:diguanylate cyclase (GGDEF)-like protein
LSGINSSIMRIRERDALFAEACRIAIDLGQFRLAWIGLIDTACGEFKPICHAGHEAGYLDMIRIVCDAESTRLDTVGGRLGAGRAVICTDIASETRAEFARDAALERGYRSCIMLPLHLTGKVIGTLNLYAAEPGFFDSDELKLLEELAADTSLGLEYIEKEEELHELSYYDALTGIPNRVLFADRLDQALSRGPYHARPVALLMLDIVRFKELNTAHGHHIGDRLLKEIASYLSDIVRTGDTVARTGSAAFGMILTDLAHAADAAIIAQQIADRFREPLHIDDKEIFVTIHIGIAVAPDDGQDAETIVRNADAALNRLERHAGSGYRFYTPEIYAHTLQKLDIEQELRHAIERNELHLHYQPIVDFASLKIVGCEALLRWNNAKLGSVAPEEFIPIAEGSELIVSIGEWVLKTASRQAVQWNQQGWQTNVAINISVIQLRQPDFADRINIILNESHFNARQSPLVLELTETVLMENAEYSVEILRRLRDQGLLVYIDDFGTGYSSLSYLRALPVDTLKIDMAFVRDIASNSNDALIVKTIIALADSLGKNVIAEGVETVEQLRILHKLGCTKAQGFLFSPAIPADDLFEMARKPFSLPAA